MSLRHSLGAILGSAVMTGVVAGFGALGVGPGFTGWQAFMYGGLIGVAAMMD